MLSKILKESCRQLTFQLLDNHKPSNNIKLWCGSAFDKTLKIPSHYSILPMVLVYISSFIMFNFQNSKYFEIPLLMDLSFSIEIQTLLSQITQNVVSFGTSIESLGWP
jgi:hypothetical protein